MQTFREFMFPVSYDAEDEAIRLINENDVETVVLLTNADK